MIKSIELWDFESHEHTLISDLSDFFTVICGRSDAGKSSIFRAVRLAAYGEFDQKSVRIGCKNCIVKVVTDRGSVKVTRGTENLWEVTPVGQSVQVYNRPGKGVVKQAADIIGLRLVNLGGVDIPVNIMDQSEGHFMIDELGDKDSTGSMRAQIIDEISGLSGIETLIKSVGLDNSRLVREFNQTEKDIGEAEATLPDAWALKSEGDRLSEAEVLVKSLHLAESVSKESSLLDMDFKRINQQIAQISSEVSLIPDLSEIVAIGRKTASAVASSVALENLHGSFCSSKQSLSMVCSDIAGIPDVSSIGSDVSVISSCLSLSDSANGISIDYKQSINGLSSVSSEIDLIGDVSGIPSLIINVESLYKDVSSIEQIRLSWEDHVDSLHTIVNISEPTLRGQVDASSLSIDNESLSNIDRMIDLAKLNREALNSLKVTESSIIQVKDDMSKLEIEQKEILSTIKLCPLSGLPISPSCLNQGV
jgi:DNA repair exonuclease SbcCD ATPase subunit